MSTELDFDDDFDFGFTTHADDEFAAADEVTAAQDKAEKMYKAVMPLLNNLLKDADKNAIIKWPNRRKSIEAFIKKLESILNS